MNSPNQPDGGEPGSELAAVQALVEQHEAACLAAVQAVLAAYGCELYADWQLPVDEGPRYRIGVRLATWERRT